MRVFLPQNLDGLLAVDAVRVIWTGHACNHDHDFEVQDLQDRLDCLQNEVDLLLVHDTADSAEQEVAIVEVLQSEVGLLDELLCLKMGEVGVVAVLRNDCISDSGLVDSV